ncbi:MAG: 2-amino-4-hydroxy-6-hydroxymethyldihydropteridine diphosphokinase [Acidobacteria bacterium]|nr:MAG: 2-amino-4-hydroxy-6-hydroxymethyldihydropteridine diphosphokinase [Acidobacteriota bacterium]
MAETTVYLSLGSNLGDREKNLRAAMAFLADANLRMTGISSFYETEPVDLREQPWFLNCVVQAETELPPLDLLRVLRGIEATMGSKKLVPKGPRLIDLDILLYSGETIDTPELQVPHPRMLQRKFVLVPLAEIAPNLRHPSWAKTAAELSHGITDSSVVRKFAESSQGRDKSCPRS